MASTDSTAIPIKAQAYRVVFPIFDADGDLVTGATGLDSEVSKDQGTFTDCTNEATEIATSSGIYYLDLTGTEMTADCVAVIVKTTSVGAKTTPLVLYPAEPADIIVNVKKVNGTDQTAGDLAAMITAVPDAVWDEDATAHQTQGTFGQAIGDPGADADTIWALANANLNATVGSRASQASVDDLPTNAELDTALAAADDAVLAAIAALNNLSQANIRTAVGMASANLDTQLDALPTANENAAALLDLAAGVETGLTLRQAMRLLVAAESGKLSGAATTTIVIRNFGDSKDRITATVDADGNRSAVSYDLT